MHRQDHIRAGHVEQVVIALEVAVGAGEAGATVILLLQFAPLQHGAHGAIQHQDAFAGGLVERLTPRQTRRLGGGQYLLRVLDHAALPATAAACWLGRTPRIWQMA